MVLLRNRFTGDLLEVDEYQASVITDFEAFNDYQRARNPRIIRLSGDASYYHVEVKGFKITARHIFHKAWVRIPNTKASRVLYGSPEA